MTLDKGDISVLQNHYASIQSDINLLMRWARWNGLNIEDAYVALKNKIQKLGERELQEKPLELLPGTGLRAD